MSVEEIFDKVLNDERINGEEALTLLQNADTIKLGSLADFVRRKFHPDGTVTFVADTNPNYTNVCDTECLFCAFWSRVRASSPFIRSSFKTLSNISSTLMTIY